MDWITPLTTLFQDWRNRPAAGFVVATDTAWSAYTVRDLLAAHGIRTWGWQIISGRIVFRLRAAQACFAEHIMDVHGVPWIGSSAYQHTRTPHRSKRTPRRFAVLDFFQRF